MRVDSAVKSSCPTAAVNVSVTLTFAAVNVSRIDDENFVASIEPDDEEDEEDADFRTVVVKLDSEQMN